MSPSRQTVDPPADGDVKENEREHADYGGDGFGVEQQHGLSIKVGERRGHDVRRCARGERGQPRKAQGAPEQGGREAFLAEGAVEGRVLHGPECERHEVEAVLERPGDPDVGKPDDLPAGSGEVRSHEYGDDHEDEDENTGPENTGQAPHCSTRRS